MSIRFLCDVHREQLQQSQLAASQRWGEWMEAGREAYGRRDWLPALRFLGCCFELSELMMKGNHQPDVPDLDRHMISGHYLAECFARCGESDLQRHCLLAVHYRLLQALRHARGRRLPLKHNVDISLQMLERYYRDAGRLDELTHCRRESKRLLARCYH